MGWCITLRVQDGDTEHLHHDRVRALLWPREAKTATETYQEILENIWHYSCNGESFPCMPVDATTKIPAVENMQMYMGNMQYVVNFTPAESATLEPSEHKYIATKHCDTVQKISHRSTVAVRDIVRANRHLRKLNARSVFEKGVFVRLGAGVRKPC